MRVLHKVMLDDAGFSIYYTIIGRLDGWGSPMGSGSCFGGSSGGSGVGVSSIGGFWGERLGGCTGGFLGSFGGSSMGGSYRLGFEGSLAGCLGSMVFPPLANRLLYRD